jgi:hypothetical protein
VGTTDGTAWRETNLSHVGGGAGGPGGPGGPRKLADLNGTLIVSVDGQGVWTLEDPSRALVDAPDAGLTYDVGGFGPSAPLYKPHRDQIRDRGGRIGRVSGAIEVQLLI